MVPAHTATEAGASPTAAWRRELALLLGAGLTSALAAALCLRLWRARLSEPFIYAGDYFFHIMLAKGVCETGWHLTIPAVGAPAGLRLHAFPAYDNLQLLLVKLVCLLGGDAVQALNLVYLAGYPLVGMTAFYVLRRLALLEPTALVMAVLYALLPYHFARGLGHPFLAAYYLLPPVALFA